MQIPIVSHLRKAMIRRDFLQKNPDIRVVYGSKRSVAAASKPATLSASEIEHWNASGFLILRGLFKQSDIEDYKKHIDRLWQERKQADNPLVIFTTRGGQHFRDVEDDDRALPYRLVDHYLTDAPTRDFSMHPQLVATLHQLMGHSPIVCNTILFETGSEQELHSDMFYMPPKTENQMIATWIALDDVTDDNGPIIYVPGSHKLPPHRFSNGKVNAVTSEVSDASLSIQKRMADLGLKSQKFTAKSGDVLIWHSNLMHGGDAIRDRTAKRTSIVTHYLSAYDEPTGDWLCAERDNGSLLLVKKHLAVAKSSAAKSDEHV